MIVKLSHRVVLLLFWHKYCDMLFSTLLITSSHFYFMKKNSTLKVIAFFLLLVGGSLIQGCQNKETTTPQPTGKDFSLYRASLAKDWMDITYNSIRRQGWFALDASRLYAYTAITMHESMVHGMPDGRSLVGQLNGLESLPEPDAGVEIDYGIVLCHATPTVIRSIMGTMAEDSRIRMEEVANRQESDLIAEFGLSAQVVNDSKAYADRLSGAILAWAATDNRIGLENLPYYPSTDKKWYYKPTDPNRPWFMQPFWWTQRSFIIESVQICEPEPPFPYSEDPNSLYYKDVEEVYLASFDPQKVDIGHFWANNAGASGTPAGSWLGIASQLVDQYDLDLSTTLRMYTRLAIGTRDAFLACWYMKYKYNLQRPATYIREVMGHPDWSSPVPTPPYPDYTSGTSTNAGISSEILTEMFGARSFSDAQHADKGLGTRTFTSFKEAGIQAYHSRIFGGVHMRRACELGFRHGECIGRSIYESLKLTK
jgi:hypothetical protein